MSEEVFISLQSVFSFLKATPESRCIVEGEELVNAKHLILIGITHQSSTSVDLFALCLQSSAIKSNPHEIRGKILFPGKNVEIRDFHCTCKAGLSGSCKHVAATLLKCTRSNILSLEKLSTTDIKCYWSSKKRKVEEDYEAKPISETDCFKDKCSNKARLSEDQLNECSSVLISACQDSSLSLHLQGRNSPDKPCSTLSTTNNFKAILDHADLSPFLLNLDNNPVFISNFPLRECCQATTSHVLSVENLETLANSPQRTELWHQERQFRITGSRCYSLFTYNKGDWQAKAESFFWPKKISNKYVEHGQRYEGEALNKYKAVNNYSIIEPGLIVCRIFPWLGYSPDGIVLCNGSPTRLVEIKCPYEGIENDADNFLNTCKYLEVSEDGGIRLKKKHAYYGQVQLGMAILNLNICDLVLYSSKSKTFLNVIVPFDEAFAKQLIEDTTYKYFNNMIHYVCLKNSSEGCSYSG